MWLEKELERYTRERVSWIMGAGVIDILFFASLSTLFLLLIGKKKLLTVIKKWTNQRRLIPELGREKPSECCLETLSLLPGTSQNRRPLERGPPGRMQPQVQEEKTQWKKQNPAGLEQEAHSFRGLGLGPQQPSGCCRPSPACILKGPLNKILPTSKYKRAPLRKIY